MPYFGLIDVAKGACTEAERLAVAIWFHETIIELCKRNMVWRLAFIGVEVDTDANKCFEEVTRFVLDIVAPSTGLMRVSFLQSISVGGFSVMWIGYWNKQAFYIDDKP